MKEGKEEILELKNLNCTCLTDQKKKEKALFIILVGNTLCRPKIETINWDIGKWRLELPLPYPHLLVIGHQSLRASVKSLKQNNNKNVERENKVFLIGEKATIVLNKKKKKERERKRRKKKKKIVK